MHTQLRRGASQPLSNASALRVASSGDLIAAVLASRVRLLFCFSLRCPGDNRGKMGKTSGRAKLRAISRRNASHVSSRLYHLCNLWLSVGEQMEPDCLPRNPGCSSRTCEMQPSAMPPRRSRFYLAQVRIGKVEICIPNEGTN